MSRRPVAVLLALVSVASLVVPVLAATEPVAAQATSRSWVFTGGGWGHGVGMSQWGARGMAARGVGVDAIVAHYYTGAAVTTRPSVNDIRVLLSDTADPVVVTPTSALTVALNGTVVRSFDGTSAVTFRRVSEGVEVSSGDGTPPQTLAVGAADVIDVSWANQSPVRVSATGLRYRYGHLRLRLFEQARLRVIVQGLTMQQYLYGLAEVPASWPAAALQAQAVTGRSYAQHRAEARRAAGSQFDLLSTAQDQVYNGFDRDGAPGVGPWIAAVDATADRFVVHNSSIVPAYYSSSSGGHTEHSENVFVQALPFLRGVPDPDDAPLNPLHSWSRTYTEDQMSAWLGAHADTAVGVVHTIRIIGPTGVSGRVDKASIELIGTSGRRVVTGNRLRQVINLGAGPSLSAQLPSTKFTVAALDVPKPVGWLEHVARVPGGLRIRGWTIDPTAPTVSILARVSVNGTIVAQQQADRPRADVAAAFPGAGPDHGVDLTAAVGPGNHRVCLEGVGAGGVSSLGCRTVTVSPAPIGNVDAVRLTPGGYQVSGWAIDPDTADPIGVHVYVDGRFAAGTLASVPRPDVAAAHPGYGDRHGFGVAVPAATGARTVCVYAIDASGRGPNPSIGCVTRPRPSEPIGNVEVVRPAQGGGVLVGGWALDLDTVDPIAVHVYVDGGLATGVLASQSRPDVAAAFPGFGDRRGFSVVVPGGPGSLVCVYAINVPPGPNPAIGPCRRA